MKLANQSQMAITDTYQRQTLLAIDAEFMEGLSKSQADLALALQAARDNPDGLDRKAESELLVKLAPFVDAFVGKLFNVTQAMTAHEKQAQYFQNFFVEIKRKFVQRRGLKKYDAATVASWEAQTLIDEATKRVANPLDKSFESLFAKAVSRWLADEAQNPESATALAWAEQYAAWAVLSEKGRALHHHGRLFHRPEGLDFQNLVPIKVLPIERLAKINPDRSRDSFVCAVEGDMPLRQRDGFSLTDKVRDQDYTFDQSHYCIWCHEQGRDSCSKGVTDKKTGEVQKSPLGASLAGCPLSEKISEMNLLKAQGWTIAPLAVAMVDNPMIAGTGHRICNDCMKACIYQKQEPVDIPQAETRNLETVLALPYGFEIYALLSRWNPLNIRRPLPKADTGKKVLIVGLGPAGYTLAHHLLNEGHTVVAIDGLKIEPLPPTLSGRTVSGDSVAFAPIESVNALMEDLDKRSLAGFGGVSEYGITVRWNKNYLKILRLLLERRNNFRMFGGVRFGNGNGTITIADALSWGFDHIALCMGAGKPTVIDMENGFARGVRQASDFLMALQLTGASKKDSVANLQIRMPIAVIGGGLTAIDTATESLSYYIRQVEKFVEREKALQAKNQSVINRLEAEEKVIYAEYMAHGEAVQAERALAKQENRAPNFVPLLQSWGGATVVYRRSLKESPAYVLNHEEITKALEEGIYFAEKLKPVKVEVDAFGHAAALHCQDENNAVKIVPAKSVLIAAGTQPNTVLAREGFEDHEGAINNHTTSPAFLPTSLLLDGKYFAAINADGHRVQPEFNKAKPDNIEILMHRFDDGRTMSFFGDLHPSFFGNVVKAMASAKQGYPMVSTLLNARTQSASADNAATFFKSLDKALLPRVVGVSRLTHNIIEVVIHAPQAAKNFRPGQFYRLQNFEAFADGVLTEAGPTKFAMEGLAFTGAWVNADKGEVGMIALEMGGSSNLCMQLKKDEPVVLMGPTGAPTHIAANETVLLVGGGLGNAVLFSIGAAFRAMGSKVLYFAGYRNNDDRYHINNIEAAADVIVWCCDKAPGFAPSAHRPHDKTFVGNIVEAMRTYAEGGLGETTLSLKEVDRIIAIGSDRMMAAVAQARHTVLMPYLKPSHCGVGSINSPMQCMLKEICSQCIQVHHDKNTGKKWHVFSCFNQDQDLDKVDWSMLNARLKQNSLQEKQTAAWITHSHYQGNRIKTL